MPSVTIECPACKQADSHSFYQGTENGAPHGAGYWPMEVKDYNQDCDCELPDYVQDLLEYKAWTILELKTQANVIQALQQQHLGLMKAIIIVHNTPLPTKEAALTELSATVEGIIDVWEDNY